MTVLSLQISDSQIGAAYRAIEARDGVVPALPPVDIVRWGEAAVETARQFWLRRMHAEHRSVAVFTQVVPQLIEANVGIDAAAVVLRFAQDELRHTLVCAAMVQALGGEPTVDVNLAPTPIAMHATCAPFERAVRNILYTTCLSETVAVARLVDSLDTAEDAAARAAIRVVLADEVLHGTFGFEFLRDHASRLESRELRASFGGYLSFAFAVLEREMVPGNWRQAPHVHASAQALGVIDGHRACEAFYQTIERVIVPGLEQYGLAAAQAWRMRAL